ncbi:hypothetical protein THAOC_15424, partial [Thalassiosira oceanica]
MNEFMKIRGVPCDYHHENGIALEEYDERLNRELVLRYDTMTGQAFPGMAHLTLSEVFEITEFAELIVDWDRKGVW